MNLGTQQPNTVSHSSFHLKLSTTNDSRVRRRPFCLFEKRDRWGLTWVGWSVAGLIVILAGLVCVPNIHRFLAIDCPVRGQVLVVEGWIPDHTIPGAISVFEKNGYRQLISVGGPILLGSHFSEFKTYAELTSARLKGLGVSDERIVVLETRDIRKDRTYESAVAVKHWIAFSGVRVQALDVYTVGAHARRSRLLFEKALGDDVAVGVIAAKDQTYDARIWWRSSNGARTVVGELIAYLYAAIFFHP
jgi:hypothetical protein